PLWVKLSVLLLRCIPGVLLLLVSVFFLVAFIHVLFMREELLGQFLVLALLLGIAWWVYMRFPGFTRDGAGIVFKRRKRTGSDHTSSAFAAARKSQQAALSGCFSLGQHCP